jgi:hypothetical protein
MPATLTCANTRFINVIAAAPAIRHFKFAAAAQ